MPPVHCATSCPSRVGEADREILVFVDIGAEGGALDIGVDLIGDRDEAVADHLERDRIDGVAARPSARLIASMLHAASAQPRPQWMRISPSAPISKRSPGQTRVVEPYSSIKAGPARLESRRQRGAVVDPRVQRCRRRCRNRPARLLRRAHAACAARGSRASSGRRSRAKPERCSACSSAARLRIGMAIAALVVAVEGLRGWRARSSRPGDRHLDVVALAGDSAFPHGARTNTSRGAEVAPSARRALPPPSPRTRLRWAATESCVEHADEGLGEIEPRIGQQHADGGEIAGLGRNHHGRDRQLARQRAGVQRPAAAIAEQHEVARIEPVLDRDLR